MNYVESRVYLDNAAVYGSVPGLENMRELLNRLGNPQNDLKFIHIAGTNGKGSVLAFLSGILKEAGYRVGRYISPTLFSYRERIQVNEQCLEKEALARLMTRIASGIKDMTAEGKTHPTVFEIETALGFLYFQERKCDLVILETGLGGLKDATNVVETTIMEIITSISLDHMEFLGSTLEEITRNKAGIIKPDTLVISANQKPEVMKVLEEICRQKRNQLRIADKNQAYQVVYGYEKQHFSYGGYENLNISLAGSYQIINAVLAVEAVKELKNLGYTVDEMQLRRGLEKTRWNGRFTVLLKDPVFIIDGAHNRDAAKVLRQSLELYFTGRNIFYIMGFFKDKEYEEIVKITAPLAIHIMTIQTPGNKRALPKRELADTVRKYNNRVEMAESISQAVQKSLQMAKQKDVIIAFGSLSFLGEITRIVNTIRRKLL